MKAVQAAAKQEREALPVVLVAKTKRAPAVTVLLLPGDITPVTEASIYARSSGYVRRRYVDFGDRVRAGQLLADIEAPDLDQQVAQARAALAQAEEQLGQTQAQLQQSKAQLELARVTRDRYVILVQKGALSRQDGDTQETNYRTSLATVGSFEASVKAAEENVRASRANLDRIIALQGYEKVTSPFAGVVTARLVDQGFFISTSGASQGPAPMGLGNNTPGATGSSPGELFRVAQIGTLRTLLNVPQTEAGTVHVGQGADVLVGEIPGRTFSGRVTRTSNSIDLNSRTLLTEVQIPNPQGILLPGMYAQVRLRSERANSPLIIPSDAVIAGQEGLQVAMLAEPRDRQQDSHAKQIRIVPIEVGRDYGAQIEVTSGLEGWEYVVVNPSDVVREGALVIPQAAQEKALTTSPGGSQGRGSGSMGTEEAPPKQ